VFTPAAGMTRRSPIGIWLPPPPPLGLGAAAPDDGAAGALPEAGALAMRAQLAPYHSRSSSER